MEELIELMVQSYRREIARSASGRVADVSIEADIEVGLATQTVQNEQ